MIIVFLRVCYDVHIENTVPFCIFLSIIKAGRLVGLADCYAVIVLADNVTFLLDVNRIATFR